LNLGYNRLLSSFGFKIILRRYVAADMADAGNTPESACPALYALFLDHCLVKAAPPELTSAAVTALLELAESAPVRRCRLTL
jgi:hypothetical protein